MNSKRGFENKQIEKREKRTRLNNEKNITGLVNNPGEVSSLCQASTRS